MLPSLFPVPSLLSIPCVCCRWFGRYPCAVIVQEVKESFLAAEPRRRRTKRTRRRHRHEPPYLRVFNADQPFLAPREYRRILSSHGTSSTPGARIRRSSFNTLFLYSLDISRTFELFTVTSWLVKFCQCANVCRTRCFCRVSGRGETAIASSSSPIEHQTYCMKGVPRVVLSS